MIRLHLVKHIRLAVRFSNFTPGLYSVEQWGASLSYQPLQCFPNSNATNGHHGYKDSKITATFRNDPRRGALCLGGTQQQHHRNQHPRINSHVTLPAWGPEAGASCSSTANSKMPSRSFTRQKGTGLVPTSAPFLLPHTNPTST